MKAQLKAAVIAAALCVFSAVQADARTLYVNAKAKNNKGSGLSVKKAKKTIQAAINIARKGDTILVYPGTYAPIKTNDKKITIKSVKGQKKTVIAAKKEDRSFQTVADLSKWEPAGHATVLFGFLLDGKKCGRNEIVTFAQGGTLKSCAAKNFNTECGWFSNSKLEKCLVQNNYLVTGAIIGGCTVKKTKITKNKTKGWFFNESTFVNCLIARNAHNVDTMDPQNSTFLRMSTLLNCTVADNTFFGTTSADKSKFHNCILWNNYSQNTGSFDQPGKKTLHNVDKGCAYKNTDKTNKNPKLTSAYKLKKGSYAINKGKLTKAQKKLVGTKDLAGKKRIRGKAIDRGCYEY